MHVLTRPATALLPPSQPLETGLMTEAPLPDLALGREESVPLSEERARKVLDISYFSIFLSLLLSCTFIHV